VSRGLNEPDHHVGTGARIRTRPNERPGRERKDDDGNGSR
jgi:hypothetical protein